MKTWFQAFAFSNATCTAYAVAAAGATMDTIFRILADDASEVRFAAMEVVWSGLYKLNPADPQLESAWFQPLSL